MRVESREYERDGLGADFTEFLAGLDSISSMVKQRAKPGAAVEVDSESEEEAASDGEMEMDEATRREMELLQAEDADFLRGLDELPTDESDLDSDVDLAEFESSEEDEDDDEEDDEVAVNTLQNQQLAVEKSGDDEKVESEEEELADDEEEDEEDEEEEDEEEAPELEESDKQVEEDIYGRPIVKPSESKAPSAYLPPHLRRKLQAETEAAAKNADKTGTLSLKMDEQALRELARRINGQLNRISEGNMECVLALACREVKWDMNSCVLCPSDPSRLSSRSYTARMCARP